MHTGSESLATRGETAHTDERHERSGTITGCAPLATQGEAAHTDERHERWGTLTGNEPPAVAEVPGEGDEALGGKGH